MARVSFPGRAAPPVAAMGGDPFVASCTWTAGEDPRSLRDLKQSGRLAKRGQTMTEQTRIPRPPAGLGSSGRKLWRAVCADFELETHELLLLRQVARCADDLDALAAAVKRDGAVVSHPERGPVPNPALCESRLQRVVFARLVSALRLPEDHAAGSRPQRRTGVRPVRAIQ